MGESKSEGEVGRQRERMTWLHKYIECATSLMLAYIHVRTYTRTLLHTHYKNSHLGFDDFSCACVTHSFHSGGGILSVDSSPRIILMRTNEAPASDLMTSTASECVLFTRSLSFIEMIMSPLCRWEGEGDDCFPVRSINRRKLCGSNNKEVIMGK